VTNAVIANAVKQSIAMLQKLDRHASLAMTVGVGCYAQFVIKVDCRASLAVTNVVIANEVMQSMAVSKTGSPRYARDDGCGGLPCSLRD
jgi:hypothetical protein